MGVDRYNDEQMERLRDHKVPFDQEAMWSAIQQKKKKRRGAFFFLTMALVALAIVFIGYKTIDWQRDTHRVHESNTKLSSQELNINNQNEHNLTREPLISALTEKDGLQSKKMDSEKNNSTLQTDQINKRSNSKLKNNRNSNLKKNIERIQIQSEDTNMGKITRSMNEIDQSEENSNIKSDLDAASKENNSTNIEVELDNNIRESSENTLERQLISPLLQGFKFPFLESIYQNFYDFADLEMTPSVIPPIIEPIKTKRFSIGIYGGVGYANRTLELESVVDTTQSIDLNDNTLEEVSIGLELKYKMTPRYYVRSGMEYWHVTDQRRKFSISVTELGDSTSMFEGENGIIINVEASKKHTMYQTYNVPLLFGLNSNNKRFNYFAEAGAMLNLKLSTRGELPNINEITGIEHILQSSFQVAPLIGIGASYSLSNDFELYSNVNWRGNQVLTKKPESYDFYSKQGYSALRMQLGIRKMF